MRINKEKTTALILSLGNIRLCTKLSLDNIVFPKWSDLGLLGMIFSQKVKTKEQPNGCDYDEATFQVVLRVIGGKVFMTGGRPDAYAWKQDKLLKLMADPKNIRLVGTNSAQAVINLADVLGTIENEQEKKTVADMFCSLKKDLLLVRTEAENRRCIEVTQELYDAGVTACVDSWMDVDENGEAEATQLNIGDFLIVEGQYVYCIRHDEFVLTHELK